MRCSGPWATAISASIFPTAIPATGAPTAACSCALLRSACSAAGLRLVNADLTVLAEAPRIAAHRSAMSANLAADLQVPARLINIKATTTERLGFIGRNEGLAAMASVLLSH